MKYIKLLRVQHYLKNFLILFPMIFAAKFFDLNLMITCFYGFISFSMISSAVYIINDIRDAENDRLHDIKKNRPIASGAVSEKKACILAAILILLSVLFNYISNGLNIDSWLFLFSYFAINLLYSLGLKNIPLIDITLLVSGFLLRILYGGAITSLPVSNWMYLTIISMAFYFVLGKRRNEIIKHSSETRKVLRFYTPAFLDKNMHVCLGVAIVFYSLWCVDQSTIASKIAGNLIWTVPLVMLICMRYSLNIEKDSYGDPVDVVIHDKILLILIALYGIGIFISIYGRTLLHFLGS